jgi:RNA polymerase-binding transcription factor DksA
MVVDPEHPSTPAAVERAPDLTILTKVESELADVERALARLDEGTYGTCQACGAVIDDERLAAEPGTAFCGEHQPG